MKLKEVFTGMEVQVDNDRRNWIDVEDPAMKHRGVTLDLVHLKEEQATVVFLNWKGAKLPRCIPFVNIRSFVPYGPEEQGEAKKTSGKVIKT